MPSIVTYGQAKTRFARAFGVGTDVTDPRVLEYANLATEAIMRELSGVGPDGKPWTVRGVYVGGVDVLTLNVTAGSVITLDAAHDVALQIELSTATDVNNGWYSDLDMAGCVDPDFANDALFIPQGYDSNGNRVYRIPTANVGDTVKVSAKKRFVPIAGNDADLLLVPNVEAVCDMMIALQKRQDRDNPEGGAAYFNKALGGMRAELDGYLLDPTHALARKAAYLSDESTYNYGTLGYTRARLALEMPSGLKIGKQQITRGIGRAVERLVERTNELRTTGRLGVKTGLTALTYVRALLPTDLLTITDYEQIRSLAQAFMTNPPDAGAEQRVYDLLEAREANALETNRHTIYTAAYNAAAVGSQNWFAAKWGLEGPNSLRYSDVELARLASRATAWIYEKIYEYQLVDRNRIKTGVPTLALAPTDPAAAYAVALPYEEVKFVMDALAYMGDPVNKTVDPNAQAWQDSALKLIYRRLDAELERLRRTAYTATQLASIAAGQENTLGYFTATLALEPENPDGLKISDVEWWARINKAVFEAIQHRNALSATELYSNVDGPDILQFVYRQNPADPLPYAEYNVIRLLIMAKQTPDDDGTLKTQAFALIEEDLAKAVKATRNAKWHCLLNLPLYTFGRVRAQIGLGLSEQGFAISDQKLGRMVNEAEESISYTPNFVNGEGEYQLGCVNGMVEMPDDVERIIYADICGQALDIKHRSFDYLGYPQGRSVSGNCRYENGFWLFGWGHLQDKGLSDDGNRRYFVAGCVHGALNIVVKRRWMPKKKDADVMLVQNLEAIRLQIESKLARESKDLASAGALEAASERALDRQLENSVGSATIVPKFIFPGSRRSQSRQLLRRY